MEERTLVSGLYPECYVLRGVLSNGSPWFSRRFVRGCILPGFPTLDAARIATEDDMNRMNGMGASVTMHKQRLSEDGWTWNDADEQGDE